jgi:hypothetical protein
MATPDDKKYALNKFAKVCHTDSQRVFSFRQLYSYFLSKTALCKEIINFGDQLINRTNTNIEVGYQANGRFAAS